jgi:aminomethyltransferase
MAALLRTPQYDLHKALGGQMVPFGGYEMPVRYRSIQEEHTAVRTAAGLFDVSHMSNLWVRGPGAAEALTKVSIADAKAIKPGGTKYTAMLREDGTILDDMYFFRPTDSPDLHVVPNAGMNAEVARFIHDRTKAAVEDVTAQTCIFALQGPKAKDILAPHIEADLAALKPFRCTWTKVLGAPMMVSRTGYTGEDGFELFPPAREGPRIFQALLDHGEAHGLLPIGLGARDTLRLEKGYCLAGHEFAGGRTPLEASMGRFLHWDHDFVGKPALLAQKAKPHPRLVGLKVQDKGIPRQDCEVQAQGRKVGVVTSGTLSPSLKHGIALAYVEPAHAQPGTPLTIIVRGTPSAATVVEPPFL